MHTRVKLVVIGLLVLGVTLAAGWWVMGNDVAVLNPKGTIAEQQRNLIVATVLMSLAVIIPVFAMTFGIAWKYRAGNTKAKYTPDWDHNRLAEFIWWAVPFAAIMVLAVITWITSHDLDPYKPLQSNVKPIKIQVVALQWKWLFIYPEQNIATVNFVQFPEDTPVNFEITSDAPMNSFWIPQLGGQVYAMAGMSTQLHLMADDPGSFRGSSANLSGAGFAGMNFTAKASSAAEFDEWVKTVKKTSSHLSLANYDELAEPSKDQPVTYYASSDAALYDTVIMRYMTPTLNHPMDRHDFIR